MPGFGKPLTVALVIPGLVAITCIGVIVSGVLPARSPYIALLGGVAWFGGLIEVFAVPIAIYRLVRMPPLRTLRNGSLVGVGAIPMLCFAGVLYASLG